ncbi:MAG: phosphoenolpyruvate--protein phosphotransferase [Alphaproteobacteria bacterium]|nr:phosphoenolpyruvate--protein phosphotransferase [Alphaproteobacteria bacterium]
MNGVKSSPKVVSRPLLFLRKIRDVMAASESAQLRLDELVKVIASEFKSEVCSIYLLRAGDVLELFASEGLNASAVHATRLQIGEGLVGEIALNAEPLNLSHADKHPKFAYRPETGEEKYHSFVGVPILRSEQVVGVLVVQSLEAKHYNLDQIEMLQTVVMVLAELVGSNELVDQSEVKKAGSKGMQSLHVTGTRLAPGLVQAIAVLHRPKVTIASYVAESPTEEKKRLESAIEGLQASIDELIRHAQFKEGEAQREIFEAYRLFAHDKGWMERIVQAIDLGLTAEAAVQHVQDQLHTRMNQVSSQYLRERVRDLEELSSRLLEHLAGTADKNGRKLPENFIVVAKDIGPVELLEYGRKRVKALVLQEGSPTAHIIIIARAMDIPVVGKIKNAMDLVQEGDQMIVDGDHGEIYIRPTYDVEQSIQEHMAQYRARAEYYDKLKDLPSVTKDDVRISLNMNAGLFVDVKRVKERDIDGIGLYRTELPYMLAVNFPDVESQRKTYAKVMRQAGQKKVVFRTFDVGGDKPLPYFNIQDEENPAMGWRATRIGIDRPSILRRQCRALIAAGAGRKLEVMFPFIAEVSEFDEAKALFDREIERAKQRGQTLPSRVRLGAMIEIPSILWQIEDLAKRADFLSIGSNDLIQFLFASDRGNPRLSDRYDALSPVVLQIFRNLAKQCDAANTELSFCGELARKPLEAMALIGLGIRSLSLSASGLGPVKAMVRSVDMEELTRFMDHVCTLPERSVRERLAHYARDHNIEI